MEKCRKNALNKKTLKCNNNVWHGHHTTDSCHRTFVCVCDRERERERERKQTGTGITNINHISHLDIFSSSAWSQPWTEKWHHGTNMIVTWPPLRCHVSELINDICSLHPFCTKLLCGLKHWEHKKTCSWASYIIFTDKFMFLIVEVVQEQKKTKNSHTHKSSPRVTEPLSV